MDSSTVKPPSFLVSQFNKPYVKFTVDVVTPTTSHSENAFDRLMAGSRRLFQMERQNRMPQLPAMKSSWVYTERCFAKPDLLEKNGLQFKDKHQVDMDGALMLRVLTDTLWNIDEHHEKINHRATFSADVLLFQVYLALVVGLLVCNA